MMEERIGHTREGPPPVRRPYWLLGLSLAALVAVLLLALWGLSLRPAPLQVVQLPNGEILPPAVAQRFGGEVYTQPAPAGSLVFWVRCQGPNPDAGWNLRASVLDEHGCTSRQATGNFSSMGSRGTSVVNGWSFSAFPRRGRTLRLRLMQPGPDYSRSTPVGEFTVPNPAPGPYPQWTPEPLPATRRDGGLAVTLTRVLTDLPQEAAGASGPMRLRPLRPGEETWTRTTFRIEENGRASGRWYPVGLTVSDATSSTWQPGAYSYGGSVGAEAQPHFAFEGSLWPDERAWRLRYEFSRKSGFAPDELWTVRDVPVPRKGQRVPLGQSTPLGGTTLRLKAIAGPGGPALAEMQFPSDGPQIGVEVVAPLQGQRLTLASAMDDRGHRLASLTPSGSSNSTYLFVLAPSDQPARFQGARALDLTFALHRSRYVEFTVAASRP